MQLYIDAAEEAPQLLT